MFHDEQQQQHQQKIKCKSQALELSHKQKRRVEQFVKVENHFEKKV